MIRCTGTSGKLIFLCGKMASGKSTLARELANREDAVLLVQDELLDALFPGEITNIAAFVERYTRLKNALAQHICDLLSKGIPRRARFRSRHEDTAGLVSRTD
jgi:predicted kinase